MWWQNEVDVTVSWERGGWLLRFRSSNTTAFRAACEAVKRLPLRDRTYDADERAWWVSAPGMLRLAANWDALYVATHGDQAEARYSSASAATMPQDVAQAFKQVRLAQDAPAGLVKAARRWWARELHPDVDAGRDLEAMQKTMAAADLAEEWAGKHPA